MEMRRKETRDQGGDHNSRIPFVKPQNSLYSNRRILVKTAGPPFVKQQNSLYLNRRIPLLNGRPSIC